MGVPQFFHWLVTHFDSDVLRQSYPGGKPPEYLFLDFNCGIHPAAKAEGIETQEQMYQACCDYLEKVVKIVKPTKMVYVAIDGVAPMAKMRQQRFRRFKAVQDKEARNRIDRKFKCYKPQKFDFNMISPGTVFMKELTIKLKSFIQEKWGSSRLQVVLDDAGNPGEGEHKIMGYLREKVPQDARVVVYGLDSDLIFLCLINHRPNFSLFREKIFFGQKPKKDEKEGPEQDFTYLDVTQLRKIIISMMNPELNREELERWQILQPKNQRVHSTNFNNKNDKKQVKFSYSCVKQSAVKQSANDPKSKSSLNLVDLEPEKGLPIPTIDDFDKPHNLLASARMEAKLDPVVEQRLILDYVALSFILGNDFLPHIPHLKIKEGGLNQVIEAYKEIQVQRRNFFLVEEDGQNFDIRFFRKLMQKLAESERELLKEHREAADLRRSRFKSTRRYRLAQPYDKAVLEWEYVENQYKDTLRLGEPGWKSRFYLHYFKDDDPALINDVIHNFLEGLVWMLRYYQGDCPSWSWCYRYRVSPALTCITSYLEDNGKKVLETISGELEAGRPVKPEEQLLMILPPQSHKLLEPEIAKLMKSVDSPLSFMYPIDFKIDLQGHRYRWECYPILPPVDPELVHQVVQVVIS